MKVLTFVGSRADFFPIAPVLAALQNEDEVDLHVVTAIGFNEGGAAALAAEFELSGATHHDLGLFLTDGVPAVQMQLGAELAGRFAETLTRVQPDVVIVLGDRWELLYVAPAVILSGVRMVHLHGGEVTEGAIDDRVRHAVTKLADQHCVSTAQASRRIAQLGEEPDRIHVTGAPGLDRFGGSQPVDEDEFMRLFGVPLVRPLVIATYHPVTAAAGELPGILARRIFDAALQFAGTLILTHPGPDTGRDGIVDVIDEISAENASVIVRPSLGSLYTRVMATADLLLGNSSSGVIEAASFGLPVVNVGERQFGRETGPNIIHSSDDKNAILSAVEFSLSENFKRKAQRTPNLYGDGRASARIVDVVLRTSDRSRIKKFIDTFKAGC